MLRHTVNVELGLHRYPIHIGEHLLQQTELLSPHVTGRVLVVTNETIAPLYLKPILATLAGYDPQPVILPDGEQYKLLDTLDTVYEALLSGRFDRGCTVVALGGGVIGDMAGFVAASYQRGVNFVQIPTTLLAQVDSSVGGKTGVNHRLGKNMIGAFHQPSVVLADMGVLSSLPEREWRAGLAEVIKYGFILDARFLDWLEEHLEPLLAREPEATAHAVRRSCEIKAGVVVADEHERGQRALLNLGHTFGHAIEGALGYGQWLHGEAVAAGTAMAMDLSCQLGLIDASALARGRILLERAGLPLTAPAGLQAGQLLDYMQRDKKTQDGRLRLVLLRALGEAFVHDDPDLDQVRDTLERHLTAA